MEASICRHGIDGFDPAVLERRHLLGSELVEGFGKTHVDGLGSGH